MDAICREGTVKKIKSDGQTIIPSAWKTNPSSVSEKSSNKLSWTSYQRAKCRGMKSLDLLEEVQVIISKLLTVNLGLGLRPER